MAVTEEASAVDPFDRALALERSDDFRGASAAYLMFAQTRRDDKRTVAAYKRALRCLIRTGSWDEIETVAAEALVRFPDLAAVYQHLGEARLARGDREGAQTALSDAVRLDPTQADARALFQLANDKHAPRKRGPRRPRPWPKRVEDFEEPVELIRRFLVDERDTEKFITRKTQFIAFGSCFAQNLGGRLAASGYRTRFEAIGEDVNSTYANRYLLEWVERGAINGPTTAMQETYGDPLRERLLQSIKTSDVAVLTLGVAPCFFHVQTGEFSALIALPPTVRRLVLSSYVMRTTTVAENVANIHAIIDALKRLSGKKLRVVVTISPVPLAGTTEFSSAITADCLSKSTLRVACEEALATRKDEGIIYWPSFEIVRWLGAHYSHALPPVFGTHDGKSRHVSPWLIDIIIDRFLACYAGPN
jgi:hypothetical protein